MTAWRINGIIQGVVLNISIPPEIEAKLRTRAQAAGKDLPAYVSGLVKQWVERPVSLEELSGPIAKAFAESGMTEDELAEFLEEEKHAMRAERNAGRGG
jgi:hypothetical protein